ncbi:hypothetical protein DENSPDRAFT_843593 [Dentipellis sp. KUC8613]|nr:hypothetical protein DENSPDRAFT_843593 [Dentipellis sp. KUC8613]
MSYDYLLTLPDEIELVWRSRWTMLKVIFLLNRYSALWDVGLSVYDILGPRLSSSECSGIYTTHGWLVAVGIAMSEIILSFRTYALWGESKQIAYFLGSLAIVALTVIGFSLNKALHSLEFIPIGSLSLELRGCFVTKVDNAWYGLIWSLALASETIIMIMTAIKAWQGCRSRPGSGPLPDSRRPDRAARQPSSPLLYTVFRDGILSYLPLFMSSLMNVLLTTLAPPGYTYTLSQTQHMLHMVLTSRIVLNIRRKACCEAVASNFENMELAQTISDFVAAPGR